MGTRLSKFPVLTLLFCLTLCYVHKREVEGRTHLHQYWSIKKFNDFIALSGCDTVPVMFNIGKVKCINVAKKNLFQHLGKVLNDESKRDEEGKHFTVKCYGLDQFFRK